MNTTSMEPTTTTTFKDLWLAQKFLDELEKAWYTHPTPIQEKAIPHALEWKDVFGCAQTGTWKTAAFSLPMLHRLDATHDDSTSTKGKKTYIRSLILTPTRELATQIHENLLKYWKKTNLRSMVIFGWVGQNPQVKKLRKWVEIVIATPGRLLDLINQKHVNLSKVEIFTLDEADRMLDMGFIHDIRKIHNHIPKKVQTLFFSATMDPKIMELAHDFLRDPTEIRIAPQASTVDTVSQSLYMVSKENKKDLLLHFLKTHPIKSVVVFMKTKHAANKLEKFLIQHKIKAAAIHGNKSQNNRQKALKALQNGSIKVLVATDVAARGIDVSALSHVINFDIPLEPEAYVHRIWRTGRAWLEGDAMTMYEPWETKYLKQIVKLIGKEIPLERDHPYHLEIDMTKNYPTGNERGGRGWRSGWSRGKWRPSRGWTRSSDSSRRSIESRSWWEKKRYSGRHKSSDSRTSSDESKGSSRGEFGKGTRKNRDDKRGGRTEKRHGAKKSYSSGSRSSSSSRSGSSSSTPKPRNSKPRGNIRFGG